MNTEALHQVGVEGGGMFHILISKNQQDKETVLQ